MDMWPYLARRAGGAGVTNALTAQCARDTAKKDDERMADLALENVSKIFKDRRGSVAAVDKLDLAVDDRQLVVLVGPSGCGKTTTLRLVAGLEKPTTGTIRIGGRDVTHAAPKDRDIAMVFQTYALYPHMSVYENMAFGLKMRRVSKDEIRTRVCESAGLLGLDHLLDRKPAALSGGECQRVALGRAIVRNPQLFLFDEPLSNLDPGLRAKMRTEIKSLQQRLGATMLYVTHDQEEAMTLGQKLVIMDNGAIQQQGAPLEVYNRPANRFVAGFIGTPPMNFMAARLERDGDAITCNTRAGRMLLPSDVGEAVRTHVDREVVMGIRPAHLQVEPAGRRTQGGTARVEDNLTHINATVTLLEPLGDVVYVHLSTAGGESLIARTSPDVSICPGDSAVVTPDLSKAHLFASDGGRRIN